MRLCALLLTPSGPSFLQTLEALLATRDRFDHVLVETTGAPHSPPRPMPPADSGSGLADPGPVCAALWADDAVEPGARLGGVVTVVDALHFLQQLGEAQAAEAQAQVAYADVVLLNKADLAVRGAPRARSQPAHAPAERGAAG